ncbi:MAG: hypothetical protein ACKO1N_01965 [Erythrobacter sp.]
MQRIVSDDQRSPVPNSARPGGVGVLKPAGVVTPLAGATSPCRAPFLSSGLLNAIRVGQVGRKPL